MLRVQLQNLGSRGMGVELGNVPQGLRQGLLVDLVLPRVTVGTRKQVGLGHGLEHLVQPGLFIRPQHELLPQLECQVGLTRLQHQPGGTQCTLAEVDAIALTRRRYKAGPVVAFFLLQADWVSQPTQHVVGRVRVEDFFEEGQGDSPSLQRHQRTAE